jgi:hypothetical protein
MSKDTLLFIGLILLLILYGIIKFILEERKRDKKINKFTYLFELYINKVLGYNEFNKDLFFKIFDEFFQDKEEFNLKKKQMGDYLDWDFYDVGIELLKDKLRDNNIDF